MTDKVMLPKWTLRFPEIMFAAEKYPEFRQEVLKPNSYWRRKQLSKMAHDLVGDIIPV